MTTTSPYVEHTGDGTLVHNTDRDDDTMRNALKAAGFRWGRSIAAWYLPRTWTFARRGASVRQLVAQLEASGRTIEVHERRERERSSAEVEAERVARAEARAERLTGRAAAAAQRSDDEYRKGKDLADRIPLGQPILAGHHSQRRAERDRDFIGRQMGKSVEAYRQSQEYERRAAAAAHNARRNENPAVIARRLERLEADRRRMQRRITGTDSPWSSPATGDHLTRLKAEVADLDEQITWNRQALAEAEAARGRLWRQSDFRKGDQVLVLRSWYPVLRVNRKTVTVTPLIDGGEDKNRSWTDTVPYDQIKGRRRDGIEHTTPPTEEG